MFKFIFVIFFFCILLVCLLGFSVLRTIKNVLFGSGNSNAKKGKQKRKKSNSSASSAQNQSRTTAEETYAAANRKKIFTKDEGEYVDFEEVK